MLRRIHGGVPLVLTLILSAAAVTYLFVRRFLPAAPDHPQQLPPVGSSRQLQVLPISTPAEPPSITVSGSCIPELNAVYTLQSNTQNGRPSYATADGLTLHWLSNETTGGQWCFDWSTQSKLQSNPSNPIYAYTESAARSPPDGTTMWYLHCSDKWREVALTLTTADNLASAPQSVSVSGSCEAQLNGVFVLQPNPLNGKPYYATEDGRFFVYWSLVNWNGTPFGSWNIDADEDPTRVYAYTASDADSPPDGTTVWQQSCNGEWGDSSITLEAQQSGAAAGVLALAPRSLTVTGSCALDATEVFTLQSTTVSGKPCFVTSDGRQRVYWNPALERTADTAAAWVIENDVNTGAAYAVAYIPSTTASPPSGMMAWWQACDGAWVSTTLTVAAASSTGSGHRRSQADGGRLVGVLQQPDATVRRRRAQTGGDHLYYTTNTHASGLVHGTVSRTDTIAIKRADVEARAAIAWQTWEQRTTAAPPTLDEMLVHDTAANLLLQSLFAVHQQPYVTFPLVVRVGPDHSNGHRRLQTEGDNLYVTVEMHAPSLEVADQAQNRVLALGSGRCDISMRTQAVNTECCDEADEDCSTGRPSTCNIGCADELIPFFHDCDMSLGKHASDYDDVVALCQATLDGRRSRLQRTAPKPVATVGRRRAQTGGGHLFSTTDTHAVCGLGSLDVGCTAGGQIVRRTELLLQRGEVESLAQSKFEATPVQQRTAQSAPTFEEMLTTGTPANAFLTSLFVQEERPQVVVPIGFSLSTEDEHDGSTGNAGHRRVQTEGDQLYVTIETHAATPTDAERAVQRVIAGH